MSRTNKSLMNILSALFGQFLILAIGFVSRMVFIDAIGKVYLGVNSLFSGILSLLSLAELGFGTAIIYNLYKPLSENDTEKVSTIMNFYKRIYITIGVIILCAGLAITPFIQYLIKQDDPTVQYFELNKLRLYFMLFLTNSVSSYFLAYKKSIIIADQKRYITNLSRYASQLLQHILQIILLILTKSFIIYLIVQISCTVLDNIVTTILANKKYPYLKVNKRLRIGEVEKKKIFKNVRAMMMHKLGGVAIFGSTSVIISAFISLIVAGLYSNYVLIITAVNVIIAQIFDSFTSSIGNINAEEGSENTYKVFKPIFFMNAWLVGFCAISLMILLNHFISLWLGVEFIFDTYIVAIIVISFFMNGMRKSVLIFRDALGLFWYDRYKPIFETVIGVGLSIGLSYIWGIFGVILGYTLATFFACLFVEPYILYKYGFKTKITKFFINYAIYTLITIFSFLVTNFISSYFSEYNLKNLFFKILICVIVPNLIFLLLSFKTKEFKYLIEKVIVLKSTILSKLRKKLNN